MTSPSGGSASDPERMPSCGCCMPSRRPSRPSVDRIGLRNHWTRTSHSLAASRRSSTTMPGSCRTETARRSRRPRAGRTRRATRASWNATCSSAGTAVAEGSARGSWPDLRDHTGGGPHDARVDDVRSRAGGRRVRRARRRSRRARQPNQRPPARRRRLVDDRALDRGTGWSPPRLHPRLCRRSVSRGAAKRRCPVPPHHADRAARRARCR